MFCGKCGANLGEGVELCPNCDVAQAPVAQAPVADAMCYDLSAPDNESFVAKILKDKKKLGIIGGALVVIIAVIIILVVTLSGGAKSTLETYLEFQWNAKGDAEEMISIIYPDELLEANLIVSGMSMDEYVADFEEEQQEEREELQYEGIEYTFDIVSEKPMKDDDIEEYDDDLYGYDLKVSEGIIYRVKITQYVDGDEYRTYNYEYKMVKIDGDWYAGGRKNLY